MYIQFNLKDALSRKQDKLTILLECATIYLLEKAFFHICITEKCISKHQTYIYIQVATIYGSGVAPFQKIHTSDRPIVMITVFV